MENTLLVGLSRQMSLWREIDIVANNIANVNTTGFKADNTAFSEYLASGARNDEFAGKDRRVSFVQDRNTWINLSQGAIEGTGNPLDVAIDGSGYLIVQTPRGQRYTRNGSFSINATGQLVTGEGYQVIGAAGPITFQIDDRDINISSTGIITARDSTNQDVLRGQLQLVSFDQQQMLQKDGGSTFFAPPGVTPNPASPNSRLVQGALEKSNVNAVAEMARMIEITRYFSDLTAILQQEDGERRNALQELSQVA